MAALLFQADDAVDLALVHEVADLAVAEAAFGALEAEDRHRVPHACMIRPKYQGLAKSGIGRRRRCAVPGAGVPTKLVAQLGRPNSSSDNGCGGMTEFVVASVFDRVGEGPECSRAPISRRCSP